jgi:L-alanine-DL-glutamate epimerase-like enolase superfamily enzyme
MGPLTVDSHPTRVPLRVPFRTSQALQADAELVQVRVRSGTVVGIGEAAPQPENGETTESVLETITACAAVVGDDPFELEAIESRTRPWRDHSAALAGLDAALHDLCGKLLGQPVWRLLGLSRRGARSCLTVSLDEPDAMAASAQAWLSREPGLEVLKLKLGGDDLDVERVRAVRAVTSLALLADANGAWTLDRATDALPELAALGVELVEQPLAPGDPDAVRLKSVSPLPLIADEDCRRLEDVFLCASRAHGINIKLAECGGIREALRMIHTARALGMRVMVGCMVESSLGIAAALQFLSLVDVADLDGNLHLAADPWSGVEWVDGRPLPGTAPGLGLQPKGPGAR